MCKFYLIKIFQIFPQQLKHMKTPIPPPPENSNNKLKEKKKLLIFEICMDSSFVFSFLSSIYKAHLTPCPIHGKSSIMVLPIGQNLRLTLFL